jgi:hypothetical protein
LKSISRKDGSAAAASAAAAGFLTILNFFISWVMLLLGISSFLYFNFIVIST